MEFVEAPGFTRTVANYLDDSSYHKLQIHLATNPESGDLMAGTGGFRKLRWADPRLGKGKRGGLRIIYFHFADEQAIWFMAIYDKSEAEDLDARQKRALKSAILAEKEARKRGRK